MLQADTSTTGFQGYWPSFTAAPVRTRVRGSDEPPEAASGSPAASSSRMPSGSSCSYGEQASGRQKVTNLRLPGQYDERLLAHVGLKGPYYNGQRWYLPQLARYMELDPIALRGGLNGLYAPDWYGYGNANPVKWTDATGEFALLAPGAVVGALMGGIYGVVGAAIAPGATWQTVVGGGAAGFVVGGLVGAYLGSGLGLSGTAIVGGASAAAGSWLGQLAGTWLGSEVTSRGV